MNNRTLNYYIHELHWHLPAETQQESVEYLIENASLNELGQLFVLTNKPHLKCLSSRFPTVCVV